MSHSTLFTVFHHSSALRVSSEKVLVHSCFEQKSQEANIRHVVSITSEYVMHVEYVWKMRARATGARIPTSCVQGSSTFVAASNVWITSCPACSMDMV